MEMNVQPDPKVREDVWRRLIGALVSLFMALAYREAITKVQLHLSDEKHPLSGMQWLWQGCVSLAFVAFSLCFMYGILTYMISYSATQNQTLRVIDFVSTVLTLVGFIFLGWYADFKSLAQFSFVLFLIFVLQVVWELVQLGAGRTDIGTKPNLVSNWLVRDSAVAVAALVISLCILQKVDFDWAPVVLVLALVYFLFDFYELLQTS